LWLCFEVLKFCCDVVCDQLKGIKVTLDVSYHGGWFNKKRIEKAEA
jgi:hypothetical protein